MGSVSRIHTVVLVAVEKPLPKAVKFASLWRWLSSVMMAAQGADHHCSLQIKAPQSVALVVMGLSQRLTGPWSLLWAAGCASLRHGELKTEEAVAFVYLQMSPGKEITQVGAALQETPRSTERAGIHGRGRGAHSVKQQPFFPNYTFLPRCN